MNVGVALGGGGLVGFAATPNVEGDGRVLLVVEGVLFVILGTWGALE